MYALSTNPLANPFSNPCWQTTTGPGDASYRYPSPQRTGQHAEPLQSQHQQQAITSVQATPPSVRVIASPSATPEQPPTVSAQAAAQQAVMGRTHVIHINDVARAKTRLEEIADGSPADAPFLDNDGDASWGAVILCDSTTWKDFERWLNVNEGRIRRWVFEPHAAGSDRGRVVIYSLPTIVHERVSKSLVRSIMEQIQTLGDRFDLIRTVIDGEPTCRIETAGQEPDASLTPTDLVVGNGVFECNDGAPFPNLVIETAYLNDDLDGLITKLTRWMDTSTSVQVAIGIKIFASNQRRIAFLYQRGQANQQVEFGHDVHGNAPLALTFPLASVYIGVDLPHPLDQLDNPQISIDLIALRAVIDDYLARRQAAQQIRAQQARTDRLDRRRNARVTRPVRRARTRANAGAREARDADA